MAQTSDNFQKLLEPGLRKVFFETYNEKPEQYSKVFNVLSSKKAKEDDHHVGGTGLWEEKKRNENIKYETIEDGLDVTYTHKAYAKGIQVERELYDDDQYNIINKMPKTIARGGRALVEQTAADILNNGFSNTGFDGKHLFADDHTQSVGAGDNVFDSKLNLNGLKAGMLLARNTKDDKGLKISCEPDQLIIPPDLEWDAVTLLESKQKPGTANNDNNPALGKLKSVVLDYLTSATAWFLQDTMYNELNFFWRVRPEFKSEENFDNMVAKYRGYLRFSVGYSDWRGIVGSDGSGQ